MQILSFIEDVIGFGEDSTGFIEDVTGFLKSRGIEFSCEGNRISFPTKPLEIILVPLIFYPEVLPSSHPVCQWEQNCPEMLPPSHSVCQWERLSAGGKEIVSENESVGESISAGESVKNCVHLYEDRWRCSRSVTSQRLMARLGKFRRIHARLCKVVSEINCKDFGVSPTAFKEKIKKFLDSFHTYGYLNRQTGYLLLYKDDIVAAAQFQQTYQPHTDIIDRPLDIDGEPSRKYEWTRYASLPDVRIAGGMGKILEQFVRDVRFKQDDEGFEIMSYSDNEWGEGDVYRKLGFELAGSTPPVAYHIDPQTFRRINPRQWSLLLREAPKRDIALMPLEQYPVIRNQGSLKWKKLY